MASGRPNNSIRRGGWIQTYTGRQFWPLDPRPEDIYIEDIAHALSNICRFNGHCKRFYSVAEHSIYVMGLVTPQHYLWALLHDASEAYLCDIPSPIKADLYEYRSAEQRVTEAVCRAFDLPFIMPEAVKDADATMLATERQYLMEMPPAPWQPLPPPMGKLYDHLGESLLDNPKQRFLDAFHQALDIHQAWRREQEELRKASEVHVGLDMEAA